MDTFFHTLKQLLVGTIFVVFAFVMTYVPQAPTSQVDTVEAAASGSVVYDPTNTLQNSWTTAQATISAALGGLEWGKAISLDGIAWSFAKRAVTMMAADFLNWVNSGFTDERRPMFVQDLRGFLTEVADAQIGSFISELGDVGSFICEPFRFDIQVAVATRLNTVEDRERTAPSCTLTGVIDNIQGFIDGSDPGRGLADWLTITATPQTYTPYGSLLSAEIAGRARLINAQGEELQLLEFGGGFFSQSVCQAIEGTDEEECSITTPGNAIAGQVNKVLGLNQDILVNADEINEYIGELVTALANQAIIGGAGLLGLSGGGASNYGGSSNGSILDQIRAEADDQVFGSIGNARTRLEDTLQAERNYRSSSQELLDDLAVFIADNTNPEQQRTAAAALNEEIFAEITRSDTNIASLEDLLVRYQDSNASEQLEIFTEYSDLDITDAVRREQNLNSWRDEMRSLGISIVDPRLSGALFGTSNQNLLPSMEADLESEEAFLERLRYYQIHFQANRNSLFTNTITYPNGYSERFTTSGSASDAVIDEIILQRTNTQNNIDRLEFLIERHPDADSQEIDEMMGIYMTLPVQNDLEKDAVFDAWDRDAERIGIYSPSIVYQYILENDIPVTNDMLR